MLAAVETTPGRWELVDTLDRVYAVVELRRVNDGQDVRYRVEHAGELLGWGMTLRTACMVAHRAHIRAHGPAPFPGYPKYSTPVTQAPRAAG